MKNYIKIFVMFLGVMFMSGAIQKPAMAQQGYVSFQVFYDQLSPYGQWVQNPTYGFVWIPDAGPDFSPYSTNGYWVMTDYGWTWVSDYEWGWAPFHYGRWDFDNYYGWFWVPDNEWGPAWVSWRRADNYFGWAPLRPGISISMSFGEGYNNTDHWYFIRDRDFGRHDMQQYYVNRQDNDAIIRRSTVINNTYIDNSRHTTYIAGPRKDEVQKVTGRSFSNVEIQDNDRPGQKLNNNQLKMYRPQIERNNNGNNKPAPSRITNRNDIKPAGIRNSNDPGNSRSNDMRKVDQNPPQKGVRPESRQSVERNGQQQQTDVKNQKQVVPPDAGNRRQQQTDVKSQKQVQPPDAANRGQKQMETKPPVKEQQTGTKSQPRQKNTVKKTSAKNKSENQKTTNPPKKRGKKQ